jgi:hypothetical protein
MGINLVDHIRIRDAVAEHVMGYERYAMSQNAGYYILLRPDQLEDWTGVVPAPDGAQPYADYNREVPEFPSDMAAAWQVVERMNRYSEYKTEAEEMIYANWLNGMDRHKLWKYPSKRAARKVCEIALEAVGYQHKEG